MTRFPNLFTPLKLGPYTLRNRIESAPMGMHGTPEGYITPEGTAYYELRAKGGAAIVCLGESMIDSKGTSHGKVTPLDDPGILPSLIATTDAIKRHGAVSSIELLHAGIRSRSPRPDGAVYGPSAGSSFYAADPVTPAPTEAPPANLATTTDLMTYIAGAAIAIIVAIALVGVLILRKP